MALTQNQTRTRHPAPLHRIREAFLKPAAVWFIHALVWTTPALHAQEAHFKVIQNDNKIGWIQVRKTENGSSTSIRLDSEIKKRMIFVVSVIEKQHAQFNDGIMMKSYVYRKVNDDIKMDKHTLFTGSHYEVNHVKNSSERVSIQRIHYNQLSLYFKEPVNIPQVYSDNYQQLLPIVKTGDCYRVMMPDGNTNFYYYKNGVCTRVTVKHTLFTVDFIRI